MKILMMTSYSFSGRYWQDIAINFKQRSDLLAIASLDTFSTPDWSFENNHVTYLKGNVEPIHLFRMIRLWRAIKGFAPEIIQTHLFRAGLIGLLFGKMLRIPVVVTRHHIDEHFQSGTHVHRFLDKLTIKVADAVIVRSLAAKTWLVEVEGAESERVFVVNQGFDFDLLSPTELEIVNSKKELGMREENFNILCVARYSKTKGQEFLVEAVSTLLTEIPKIRLYFIGPGDSAWLNGLVEEKNINHVTEIFSSRADIPACLASADLVVHPSLVDSFSQLLIEVQAVGTAVVATDIAAAREQIDDGETGIIVSPRDSEEIAEAIRRLYFDGNLRIEMGKRGSVRVRQKYPIQTMVDQDLHVLQSCSN